MTTGPYSHPDAFRVGPADQCPKCFETRADLITRIEDKRGVQFVCSVCANDWRLRTYDDARAEPLPCRCGRAVTRPEQCDGPPCPLERFSR